MTSPVPCQFCGSTNQKHGGDKWTLWTECLDCRRIIREYPKG